MGQTTEVKIGQINHLPAEEPMPSRGPIGGRPKRRLTTARKVLLLIGGILVLTGLVIGGIAWSHRGLVTVQTGKVLRQDLSAIVTASGEIKPPPDKFATVNANSFGKVTEILVKEGDSVKKGQLLMRTEDVQQEADVRAQEAALTSARADARVQEAAVQSATANLQTAQANLAQAQAKLQQAKDDFARAQQMFKEQLIARQVFDQDLSNYQVAEAAVESSKAQVEQARAQLRQATFNRDMSRARVLQAQAQLIGVKDARNKTIYTAPFDGIITYLPVHVGENVVPGIQNQPGSALFQVANLSVINAVVNVDETDILGIKYGQPAEVSIDAIPDKTFKGRVTEIGMSAVSSTSGQTTTNSSLSTATSQGEAKDFTVSVTLDNPPPGLRPGLSATAKITTATRKDAVVIPIQALTVRDQAELEREKNAKAKGKALAAEPATTGGSPESKKEIQGVFVVKDGRAVFTPVKTGIMGTMNVEVLSGLQPGEQIVTGSYQVLRTLKNDARVKVDNSVKAMGPPSS
ncbi:MAG TPA: efflux RND transporter periplasmic adaptor subunit [Terriglobia bacterium]|jgi:HlyD family secretion protein|nr:efflux RND transporter periplasmic adaptor subunit [Terriglobia bacterium]